MFSCSVEWDRSSSGAVMAETQYDTYETECLDIGGNISVAAPEKEQQFDFGIHTGTGKIDKPFEKIRDIPLLTRELP